MIPTRRHSFCTLEKNTQTHELNEKKNNGRETVTKICLPTHLDAK